MIQEYKIYMMSIKGAAANTVAAYARDLGDFAKWAKDHLDDARWSAITRDHIDQYIIDEATRGMSAATTNRKLSAISSMYDYLKRQGHDIKDPTRWESRKPIAKTVPNTIPMSQLKAAYQHSAGTARAMLGLFMTTGIRIQELIDMRSEDINPDTNAITIHGKGSKERTVYTIPQVIEDIKLIKRYQYGPIFSSRQREVRQVIYDSLRRHCTAPQLSPHAIRHTYATYLAQRGCNVTTIAKILGHDSIKTTQRYIDASGINIAATMRDNNLIN